MGRLNAFDMLAASLSAADLHAVVMGEEFVGIVHPCKLYNVLTIGSPFLYIGPTPSHISEIAADISSPGNRSCRAYASGVGDVKGVVRCILEEIRIKSEEGQPRRPEIADRFSSQTLLPRMIKILESETIAPDIVFSSPESSNVMSAGASSS